MRTLALALLCSGCTCSVWQPKAAEPTQVVVAAPPPDTTYQTSNIGFATPTGEVVIVDEKGKRATFATKSGVVFKQVNLDKPETFETQKHLRQRIHNSSDELRIDAEWIGERVYWQARTNGLRTHSANTLRLSSLLGTPLVTLCDRCEWVPVFDSDTGKTVYYSAEGVSPGIPIDVWTKVHQLTFRAVAD